MFCNCKNLSVVGAERQITAGRGLCFTPVFICDSNPNDGIINMRKCQGQKIYKSITQKCSFPESGDLSQHRGPWRRLLKRVESWDELLPTLVEMFPVCFSSFTAVATVSSWSPSDTESVEYRVTDLWYVEWQWGRIGFGGCGCLGDGVGRVW